MTVLSFRRVPAPHDESNLAASHRAPRHPGTPRAHVRKPGHGFLYYTGSLHRVKQLTTGQTGKPVSKPLDAIERSLIPPVARSRRLVP